MDDPHVQRSILFWCGSADAMTTTAAIKRRKLEWAAALSDPDQAKAWLDFYHKYWSTPEGEEHLAALARREQGEPK
jgi:alpha-beta hydrolase superfamily lysophospholipase